MPPPSGPRASRRAVATVLAAVLAGVLLAGCGGTAPASGPTSGDQSGDRSGAPSARPSSGDPTGLPTVAVPTGVPADVARPEPGRPFRVTLRTGGRAGERVVQAVLTLEEVLQTRTARAPELTGQSAVLLRYRAVNTGPTTYAGDDPLAARFGAGSTGGVAGRRLTYPPGAAAPEGCTSAGEITWSPGTEVSGCTVVALALAADVGSLRFLDGRLDRPRVRSFRYP